MAAQGKAQSRSSKGRRLEPGGCRREGRWKWGSRTSKARTLPHSPDSGPRTCTQHPVQVRISVHKSGEALEAAFCQPPPPPLASPCLSQEGGDRLTHESPDRRVPVLHLTCYGYELLRGAGLRHPGGLSQREPTEGKASPPAGGGDTARGLFITEGLDTLRGQTLDSFICDEWKNPASNRPK